LQVRYLLDNSASGLIGIVTETDDDDGRRDRVRGEEVGRPPATAARIARSNGKP
jgi:hypothetical protein